MKAKTFVKAQTWLSLSYFCLFLPWVFSDEGKSVDKSAYSLFRPTPKELMRKFATDRPDKTESPYTVDAGRFQFETDILILNLDKSKELNAERNVLNTIESRQVGFNIANLKLGLSQNSDIQLVVSNFAIQQEIVDGVSQTRMGIQDTFLRYKYNIMGNDAGPISLGLLGYVKIPTSNLGFEEKKIDGGLMVPFSLKLSDSFDLGFMGELDVIRNQANIQYHLEYITSFALGYSFSDELGCYSEIYSLSNFEVLEAWVATLDFGFTYLLWPNIQIDVGSNIGITPAASDLTTFLGLSGRF